MSFTKQLAIVLLDCNWLKKAKGQWTLSSKPKNKERIEDVDDDDDEDDDYDDDDDNDQNHLLC